MYDERFQRVLLLALCVLVFLFALHAKTAAYNGGAPAKVTPSTASKLWVSGQKMEAPPVEPGSSVLFCMIFLCLFALNLQRQSLTQTAWITPAPKKSFAAIRSPFSAASALPSLAFPRPLISYFCSLILDSGFLFRPNSSR